MAARCWLRVLIVSLLLSASAFAQEPPRSPGKEALVPTQAEKDARLGWWRDARFGMFIHWGIYSTLGGTWHGVPKGGYAEHIQRVFRIPIPVYRKEVAGAFNPVKFDADQWVALAKQAGMGYIVITAKHHDGFAMFDSKVSPYNVVQATPFHRDPMKELRAACDRGGLRLGFYYSHAFDWGEENGAGNDWDYQNPGGDLFLHTAKGRDAWWQTDPEFVPKVRRYVDEKAIPQIKELIANYHPDLLWFDTPHKIPPAENQRILAAVRQADPHVIVNGRIIAGCGDYENTSDRPAEFPPKNGDWEAVPTTNMSYGYNQNDRTHKPASHFVQLLAKAAARGGNVLMNIGPMGSGEFDPADVTILKGIGQWWQVNGEASIRGTARTPLAVQGWGESTLKRNTLYLHVFQWPRGGKLVVGGLLTGVAKAYFLAEPGRALKTTVEGSDITIDLPVAPPDPADSVIALECTGEVKTDPARLLAADIPQDMLRSFDGKIKGGLEYGQGKASSCWVQNWKALTDAVSWPVRLNRLATYSVTINYDAPGPAAAGGAGGIYSLQLSAQTLTHATQAGIDVSDSLGEVTLQPGTFPIRVSAQEITGAELFRLRGITLTPHVSPSN